MKRFENKLHLVLADKRITGTDLAKGIGVSRSAVSEWRTGKSTMSLKALAKASNFLGCSPWDIYRWVDE